MELISRRMENNNDNNDEDNNNNNNQGLGAPWDQEGNENNIEIEVEDGNDRVANGDFDGGIAVNPDGSSNSNRATVECDLVRFSQYFDRGHRRLAFCSRVCSIAQ